MVATRARNPLLSLALIVDKRDNTNRDFVFGPLRTHAIVCALAAQSDRQL